MKSDGSPLPVEREGGDSQDERFSELLASYDESLAAGRAGGSPVDPGDLRADLIADLEQGYRCLHLLEQVWPRDPSARGNDIEETSGGAAPGLVAGRRLGRFQILRQLGRGGGGVVFLAFDPLLGRKVALKVPRPEALVSPALRQRFLREARAAAGLDHPNLVPVYEAGEVGPVCYFASAYCEGTNLADWLRDRGPLADPRHAAEIVARLAEAVEHIHARGILHRDIKPGNVLLVPRGEPAPAGSAQGIDVIPKLTDFGLAKMLDASDGETRTGTVLGTPAYMAPEQVEGRLEAIGPATDVHALGVILHELLTGRPPFLGKTDADTLRRVVFDDPAPLRGLRPRTPPDLEAICLKCLEKDPTRRYAGAQELIKDLRRFQAGEPTCARPMRAWGRGLRWAGRNPGAVTAAGLVGLGVLALAIAGSWYVHHLQRTRAALRLASQRTQRLVEDARLQRDLAKRHSYAHQVRMAQRELEAGHAERAQELLRDEIPKPGERDLRAFAWHHLWQQSRRDVRLLWGHDELIGALAVSPDSALLASADVSGMVILWDLATGRPRALLRDHSIAVQRMAFSHDARHLVTSAGHRLQSGELRLWDTSSGRLLARLPGSPEPTNGLGFAARGRILATHCRATAGSGPKELRLWELGEYPAQPVLRTVVKGVDALAVAPDGLTLATAEADGRIRIRDAVSGREVSTLVDDAPGVALLSFRADGKTLAGVAPKGEIRLWDVPSGRDLARLPKLATPVESLDLSPDGSLLFARDLNELTSMLYEAATGRELTSAWGLDGWASAVDFSLDGRTLVTCILKKGPKSWEVASGRSRAFPWPAGSHHAAKFTPDGRCVVLGGDDGVVRLWRVDSPPSVPSFKGHALETWSLAFTPDGATLASSSDDHTIKLWDVATGREQRTLQGHGSLVASLAIDPRGRTLASASFDGTVMLWDLPSGRHRRTLRGHSDRVRTVAFSADGRRLASAGSDRTIRLWDLATGRTLAVLEGHELPIHSVAFAPAGDLLASAGNDRTVRLWDVATARPKRTIQGPDIIRSLAYSPRGTTVAAAHPDGTITLWDPATGTLHKSIKGPAAEVRGVAYSPDGHVLAAGCRDHTVRLWDTLTGQELLVLPGHRHWVNTTAFSPDGHLLATGSHDGAIRLWNGTPDREP